MITNYHELFFFPPPLFPLTTNNLLYVKRGGGKICATFFNLPYFLLTWPATQQLGGTLIFPSCILYLSITYSILYCRQLRIIV